MLRAIATVVALMLLGGTSLAQDPADAMYDQWERAISLREENRYDDAVAVFRAIADDHADSPEVVRRALNQIVFTRLQEGSLGAAEAAARDALMAYPDLTADTVYIPRSVNELYERLRREMFGSLAIRKPAGARIFLAGVEQGESPLFIPYVPVGQYVLEARRPKHLDYAENITIAPDGRHELELAMNRRRDRRYWVTRIGGGLLAASALVLVAGSGSEGISQLEPLPDAPGPPSQ